MEEPAAEIKDHRPPAFLFRAQMKVGNFFGGAFIDCFLPDRSFQ